MPYFHWHLKVNATFKQTLHFRYHRHTITTFKNAADLHLNVKSTFFKNLRFGISLKNLWKESEICWNTVCHIIFATAVPENLIHSEIQIYRQFKSCEKKSLDFFLLKNKIWAENLYYFDLPQQLILMQTPTIICLCNFLRTFVTKYQMQRSLIQISQNREASNAGVVHRRRRGRSAENGEMGNRKLL